jgi:hypothetical protein
MSRTYMQYHWRRNYSYCLSHIAQRASRGRQLRLSEGLAPELPSLRRQMRSYHMGIHTSASRHKLSRAFHFKPPCSRYITPSRRPHLPTRHGDKVDSKSSLSGERRAAYTPLIRVRRLLCATRIHKLSTSGDHGYPRSYQQPYEVCSLWSGKPPPLVCVASGSIDGSICLGSTLQSEATASQVSARGR